MNPSGVQVRPDASDLKALRALCVSMIRDERMDDALDLVIGLLGELRNQNDTLQVRLKSALRRLYGRRSEKLSAEQLELFERVLGESLAPTATETPAATDASDTPADDPTAPGEPAATPPPAKPTRPNAGRSGMPEGLPRTITRKSVDPARRDCAQCGGIMTGFGVETSWQVEFVPGRFVVEVTECEKVSCPRCRDAVVTAPAPAKVIPGGQPGSGVLARMIVDKAEDHLPLERQQRRMAREGWTVPTTTLEGWWASALDLLQGLHAPLLDEALSAALPQIDATGLPVLDRDHPRGLRRGHVWTAVGGRAVAFVYTADKTAGLTELLVQRCEAQTCASSERVFVVVCDGEASFPNVSAKKGLRIVLVNCNMHARRYFERALQGGDVRAALPMRIYKSLYAVERRATEEGVPLGERTRRRQVESVPLLEELRQWVLHIAPTVPPSSPLGKALRYVQTRWLSLTVFTIDGSIPLDTGEVERQIRRVAMGRATWVFSGSDAGATRMMLAASLCATCRKLGIDPWQYLRAVFTAIANGLTARQLADHWTPWAWAQKQAQQPNAQETLAVAS
jgi:transposase